ncbi:TrkH family potassium uptake protein [Alicyclobacillus mengziensis]|uniref:Trk family potassium uptake protein n=1 Tax=Alicyclobacillus mengziensis TaxID=2931921 RepID=A0A9X7Z6J2_9BACL|nr:potassium transporter TrkG [Alicyclobacillus mengziensis]QSO46263.1 Trk family potassium uptake protein [Alicyclobacillus mengziensis]
MKGFRITPPRIIALSYFGIALLGALLLELPFARHVPVSFTDSFFTSASALYVTGLSTVTTSTTWTPFGDAIIALLIQVGGAGITFVTTSFYLLMGRKISLGARMLIAEDRNFGVHGVVRLMKAILTFSFAFEGAAALLFLLYFRFVYHYTWARAIGISVFHSISAFNNAGFDLWGNSLESFTNDPFVLILTSLLIIFGGLGFIVLVELYNFRRTRILSLHTRIVLRVTAFLLVIGTIFILLFESYASMRGLSWPDKILNAWFMSVTTRTAGFDSVSVGKMKEITWFIFIILMFIGASPGSTGGGIKTTTFYTLIKTALSTARGSTEIVVGERSIPQEQGQRSLVIFLLAIAVITGCTMIDAALEPGIRLMRIVFEEVSAFGTVGLTTGITGIVNTPVKWVLIFTMYVGRIGILTLLISLVQRGQSKVKRIPERILIG